MGWGGMGWGGVGRGGVGDKAARGREGYGMAYTIHSEGIRGCLGMVVVNAFTMRRSLAAAARCIKGEG